MKLKELYEILEATGIPTTYKSWENEKKPQPPYICNFNQYTQNFYADGVVYYKIDHISIDLYTRLKDGHTESLVEDALSSFAWEKSEEYNDKEKCYQITYELEV